MYRLTVKGYYVLAISRLSSLIDNHESVFDFIRDSNTRKAVQAKALILPHLNVDKFIVLV